MNLKENNFNLEVSEESLLPFEEQVLASGLCDFALPMRFSKDNGKSKIVYECSGYSSIKDLQLVKIRDIFEVLEKSLITLNKAGEFLIDVEKVSLTTETVYYHLKHRDVKIAYIPGEASLGIFQNVLRFIGQLGEHSQEQTKVYLKRTSEEINKRNYNLKDTITFVGELRREIHLCGIE
ncbi:MAG: DUF6382 domain-containing protein [Anaerovoracaceae bacterium]